MNLNELARYIAKKETGAKQVSIAQIKEIMKIIAVKQESDEKAKRAMERLARRHRK